MAQPTLSDYQESNFTDTTTTETTGTVTWSAGDLVVVLGITGDNAVTLGTPTVSGLTFSAVTGSPTTTANRCKGYAWTATAASSSSGAITASVNVADAAGLAVFVYTGSTGIGGTAFSASLGSTTTQSLTRTGTNSHVVQIWGDWNANVVPTSPAITWTPSGETQREGSRLASHYTVFAANWGDQGASGSTPYGFSGFAGGEMTAITLEILGSAGGRTTKNTRSAPLGIEVGMNWRGGNL